MHVEKTVERASACSTVDSILGMYEALGSMPCPATKGKEIKKQKLSQLVGREGGSWHQVCFHVQEFNPCKSQEGAVCLVLGMVLPRPCLGLCLWLLLLFPSEAPPQRREWDLIL